MTHRLLEMLTYKRAAWSSTEHEFIQRFIEPVADHMDGYGNYMTMIGNDPKILWSSHIDSVHHEGGRQATIIQNGMITLAQKHIKICLGADDAAGMWLMLEMIDKRIPGLYIFHRDEESGGGGSKFIANETPELLNGIDFAIALDRKGYNSVISHQFERCCSDDFANQLSKKLGGKFQPDDTGVFTDTANYTHIIPECTNISVGYFNQHGPLESLDMHFLSRLRDRLISTDFSDLIPKRDPYLDPEPYLTRGNLIPFSPYSFLELEQFVRNNPAMIADFLEMNGFDLPTIQGSFQ